MHETGYIFSSRTQSGVGLCPSTHAEIEGFGARLARLRKAAGFTQTQLAEELGVSRRIAYREAESSHPPASLLKDLACVLNTSIEELLGSEPPKRKTRSKSLSPRLQRRLRQIENLSP